MRCWNVSGPTTKSVLHQEERVQRRAEGFTAQRAGAEGGGL